ncbi:MAG TPA: DinB family protein [Candidatus Angelobacter sp.]|nr:DinB family protein [Candidatus Angelobacter sp.]
MKLIRASRILALPVLSTLLLAVLPAAAQSKLSPLAAAIDQEISNAENSFVVAAEAMPEEKFGATPESLNISGSEFKGVRTFSAQVRHVAADNFAIWAPLTGKPEPAGINAPGGPPEMKSRSEVIKFLKDSFAYSHEAVKNLTSENELELVEFRGNKVTRISLVILALTHINDHYGQIVEYLRMNGIVPPASRPRKA